jgi:hypothetical protein
MAALVGVRVGDDLFGDLLAGRGLRLVLRRAPDVVRAALGAGGSAVGGAERSDAHDVGL